MNKFTLVLRYGSGYRKYRCKECGNEIAVPCYDRRKVVWCMYCDNTEEKDYE